MSVEKATFDNYTEAIVGIKHRFGKLITNCLITTEKMQILNEKGNCALFTSDTCAFFAVPEHDMLYRLYFHSADNKHLSSGLSIIGKEFSSNKPLVCSITGTTEYAQSFIPTFKDNGFTLRRRMRRFVYIKSEKNDFSGYKGESRATFAKASDTDEIYNMLVCYFDVYTQAIPELASIKENAEKDQISVIKKDGKIAALLYYEVHGSSLYNIFEVVDESFRGELINIELMAHRDEHIKIKGYNIKLQYGWRDMDNDKLIKLGEFHAKRWGTRPGDTVIYTFFRE